MIIDISDLNELQRFAKAVSKALPQKPTVLGLSGDLGAGKTTFSQALLKALGVTEHIPSPSYTIVNEYTVNDQYFIHADFYRLDSQDSLDLLGWDIMKDRADLILVEWPRDLIKPNIEIHFELNNQRTAKISGLSLKDI